MKSRGNSMMKTLRISFSLKNTYRINSIYYGFKQIPVIKKSCRRVFMQRADLSLLLVSSQLSGKLYQDLSVNLYIFFL